MTDSTPSTEDAPIQEPLVEDPRPTTLRSAKSLLLVNTGNGKGKSSAAFGVVMRGVARGWNVAVLQFIKSGDWKVGEEKIGRQIGVDWRALGEGFTWDSENLQHDKDIAQRGWLAAKEIIQAGQHQLVVLDELTYLMTWAWIDADDVIATLRDRPETVNVVVTGRDASQALIDIADTVTEMREIKHAYASGIRAKRGIDY
jgi:cob(I)alamin adenosyltransferase